MELDIKEVEAKVLEMAIYITANYSMLAQVFCARDGENAIKEIDNFINDFQKVINSD